MDMILSILVVLFILYCILMHFFHDSNDKKDYNELLKDWRWKKRRAEILGRDGHECQWCHTHGTKYNPLQVHHKYYKMRHGKFINPWDYPDSCYITLCKRCHEKAHEERKPPVYFR